MSEQIIWDRLLARLLAIRLEQGDPAAAAYARAALGGEHVG